MSADDGNKELTPENWLEFDPAFVVTTGLRSTSDPGWVRFTAEVLGWSVYRDAPREVARLVEAGQAAVLYGCFYYPLLAIGVDQVVRAVEAAAHFRCAREGQLPKDPTFARLVDQLVNAGLITKERGEGVHSLRTLRNSFAHPRDQTRMPADWAIGLVRAAVDDINAIVGAHPSDRPDAY